MGGPGYAPMTVAEFLAMKKKRTVKTGSTKTRGQSIETIMRMLIELGYSPVLEHEFHPERKWRFDLAIPSFKVAIEYEGVFSAKSRHTTISGYTEDCVKYNEAQILGWAVLRYTAKNRGQMCAQVIELLRRRSLAQ